MHDDTWRADASCRPGVTPPVDPDIFFPLPADPGTIAAAKAVCAHCPVTTECHRWAIDHRITDGVWGGEVLTGRGRATAAGRS